MIDGYIKTAACSPEIKVADTEFNAVSIIKAINKASGEGVRLLAFPELVITGSTCGDLLYSEALQTGACAALDKICEASRNLNMIIILGCPLKISGKILNTSVVIYNGEYLGAIPMGKYETCAETKFGLLCKNIIFQCENLPEFNFSINTEKAAINIKPSAEPETVYSAEKRRRNAVTFSENSNSVYIYANMGLGESTTDFSFSGHCMIAENGVILKENNLFTSEMIITEIDVKTLSNTPDECCVVTFDMPLGETKLTRKISTSPYITDGSFPETAFMITSNGLIKRMLHTNAAKLVLGVSGGLDSTLALITCIYALNQLNRPLADIIGISMPGLGTSDKTRTNAKNLCLALGISFREIDVTASVKQHFEDISYDINNHGTTFENAQARERTQILMDIANDINGIVIGTGDLSELALGWATYNGDQMSMYSVNAGIPKTMIYPLINYYAEKCTAEVKAILTDIIGTPISPELIPAKDGEIVQKTEDIIGPYALHDFFIYYTLKYGFPPKKLFKIAVYAFDGLFNKEDVLKWLRVFYKRFITQQFKRSCMPDGVAPFGLSLSPRQGFKMPSDAAATVWLNELEGL